MMSLVYSAQILNRSTIYFLSAVYLKSCGKTYLLCVAK
jgi:hypothetical protein